MTPSEKKTIIKTRIEIPFADAVQRKASERGMTMSDTIREALSLWLDDAHLERENTRQEAFDDFRKMLLNDKAMSAAWEVLKRGGE